MAAPASITATKLKLKLLLDKKRNKVIFAEAKKDFVDFLIYILSMPLSAAAKYLAAPSSISKLHHSIELLDDVYMKPGGGNSRITVPHLLHHVPFLPRLTPPVENPVEKTLYSSPNHYRVVTDTIGSCCIRSCVNSMMNTQVKFTDTSVQTKEASYVKDLVPYMVTDDLSVSPLNSTSVFHAVKGCEPSNVEEKEVEFGSDEALKLLKVSLHSDAPLTSVFLSHPE